MIEIGQTQEMQVLRKVHNGLRLGTEEDNILLPKLYAPRDAEVGDWVEVFVYTDSEDLPIATTLKPYGQVGDIVCLKVVDITPHGAFLDWGLPKDLLVPFARQHRPLQLNDRVVVGIGLHESTGRVIASSTLRGYFDDDVSRLSQGDRVRLMVYSFNDLGALVVVNGRHAGLIFRDRIYRRLMYGEELEGYILQVRDDRRLDITLQRIGRGGNDDAEQVILDALHAGDGWLALHDKSPPDAIRRKLQMSKKAFKRAVGSLFRRRTIKLVDQGIQLVNDAD